MRLKRFFILIISLFLFLAVKSQTVDEVVGFADKQFAEGNYSIAAREYNRAFFFGYEHIGSVSLKIGNCYNELEDYEQAASFYDRAFRYSTSDSMKDESILGKTYCLLLLKRNLPAVQELLNISDHADSSQLARSHYLRGIAYYGLEEDSSAFEEFHLVLQLSGLSDSLQLALNNEFDKVFHYKKRYNPKRSYIMSGLFPGSGQLVVGAYKEGINSMLLVAGLAFFAVEIMKYYSLLDAALTLLPWIQRYYLGGMEKAKALALSKIEDKRYESYQQILKLTTPQSYR